MVIMSCGGVSGDRSKDTGTKSHSAVKSKSKGPDLILMWWGANDKFKKTDQNLVSKVLCLLGGEWFGRGWARVEEYKFSNRSRSTQEFWCGQIGSY